MSEKTNGKVSPAGVKPPFVTPTVVKPLPPPVVKPLPHFETEYDVNRAIVITVYTILVFGFAMLSLLAIWPRTPDELALNATKSITFAFFVTVTMGPEILLATTIILAGVVGACVYSLSVIPLHLVYRDFDKVWTAWYVLRPIMAAGSLSSFTS